MAAAPMAASAAGDVPCPVCGELIKPSARVCRFCKAQLGGSPAPATPQAMYQNYAPPPPQKKSNCLLWIVLGVVGLGVLVCVGGIVGVYLFKDAGAKKLCEVNLEQTLRPEIQRLNDAQKQKGQGEVDEKDDPVEKNSQGRLDKIDKLRGSELWRRIAERAGNAQAYICFGTAFEQNKQQPLRGPKKAFTQHAEDEPIGCCPPGGHKGGVWVIYKGGKIEFAKEGSDAYKKALAALTDE